MNEPAVIISLLRTTVVRSKFSTWQLLFNGPLNLNKQAVFVADNN